MLQDGTLCSSREKNPVLSCASCQKSLNSYEKPLYVINFRDGTRWSTRWEDRTAQEMADLMHYISQQSGIPIEQVPALYNSDVSLIIENFSG